MKGGGPMSNVNYAICKVLVRPLLQGVQNLIIIQPYKELNYLKNIQKN